MPDGYIEFSVKLDAADADKELTRVKKKIMELEAELSVQNGKKTALEEQMYQIADAAVEAHEKLEALRRAGAAPMKIKAQEAVVSSLDQQFDLAAVAVTKQEAAIAATNDKLEKQRILYGGVQQQATAAGSAGKTAAERAGAAAERLKAKLTKILGRIRTLAAGALLFSIFSRAFSAFREYIGKALKTSDEFSAALARLKGALLTAFQPIFTAALPWLTALINLLARAAAMMASFVSMLFGTTAEASAAAAEGLYDEANALDKVGGSAGKASKNLASFDQLNQLSSSSGGGGGASAAAADTPDFKSLIGDQLSELEIYLAGALLALGAILTFTGANVPLGLGLMAIGAMGLASALLVDWDTMPDNIRDALTKVLLVLGTAALVIGAVLTFSGANIPLGIGLMVAGAAALGTAAALNWNKTRELLQGPIGKIVVLASGALLALGAILTFSGAALPLGIGLMVVGAAGLAATAALNWDKVVEALRGPVGAIVAIAAGALLVLGLILTLSGAALPLGIGLMVVGAAGLAATAALNWDKVVQALRGPVGEIVAIASGSLLVLGLILALSGVALPLGIALMVAGAAGLTTVTALNWDAVKENLVGAWDRIKTWWQTDVAPVFTVKYWTDKFSAIKDGARNALNDVISVVERAINSIVNKINGFSFDIGTPFGTQHIGLSLPQVSIPRLAQGAVIPPNREFLAVLGDQSQGTNIETPLSTMVAAFKQAMSESGGMDRPIIVKVFLDSQEIRAGQQRLDAAWGV